MRIAVRPCQTVPPHQHVPSACSAGDHALRLRRLAERDEHLVEHDVVEDLVARGGEALGEARGLPAVALDQLGQPRAAERAQRRPDLDAARAARELGREVGRVAHAARRGEVLGRHRHRRAQRLGVAHEREAAVVRHVEPLVRVGRPGVGQLRRPSTRCARAGAAAAHRPNAPSTCSHAPASRVRCRDRRRAGRTRRC